jgi:MinD superfamily P-loop ATPase
LSDLKQAVNTLRTIDKPHGIIVNRSGIGDKAVYTYLEEEKIPLLLEIPFDRSVAEGYSKGDIIARYEPVWQSRFIFLFDSICQQVWK